MLKPQIGKLNASTLIPGASGFRRITRVAWSGTSLINPPTSPGLFNADLTSANISCGPIVSGIAAAANGRFRTCCNAAVGGTYTKSAVGVGLNGTTAYDWYDWQLPRLIAARPDIAVICTGTNDCKYTTALTRTEVQTILAYVESGCYQLLAVGCMPMLFGLPPLRYDATYKLQMTQNIMLWNDELRKLGERIGVPYIDCYSPCALASLEWVANVSTDKIHWGNTAPALIAPKIWALMEPYFGSSTGTSASVSNPRDSTAAIDNFVQGVVSGASEPGGWLNATQGSNTTAGYTAWNPTGYGAAGQVMVGAGIKQTLTITGAGTQSYVAAGMYTGGSYLALPAAGSRILVGCWMEITSNTTAENCGSYYRCALSGSGATAIELFNSGAGCSAIAGPFWIETECYIPDAGISGGTFYFGTVTGGPTGATTLVQAIGQITVRPLGALY